MRARIRRHPERAVPDEVGSILERGHVAHVGISQDGQPYVIPMTYHYDPARPDRLYLHGSPGSRLVRYLASGAPVCITITLLDGMVYSRDAKTHSLNYRCVVGFGRAAPLTDASEKAAVFAQMTARYFPGRTVGRDYAPPSAADLQATTMVAVAIEEWSAKARRGGPNGPMDALDDAPGTRGVVDVSLPEFPSPLLQCPIQE